jgi:hypothetical protein
MIYSKYLPAGLLNNAAGKVTEREMPVVMKNKLWF